MSKMTPTELVAIIQAHRRDSLGYESGELSNDRASAMDAYNGRPYGTEVEGRSQVVSRDVAEAVDWAMPAIMRAFTQSGTVGEFDPEGPEDEEQARQESDYTNQVLMKDNQGFLVLYDAIHDTLLLRNGYVKHYWDVSTKISEESYTGLSGEQVVMMLQQLEQEGAKVEVKEQSSTMTEMGEVFDLTLKVTRKKGKVKVEAAPTEEWRVSKRCRGSLQDSPFTEHVTRKTRSYLRELGMPADFVDSLPAYKEDVNDSEVNARDTVTDETNDHGGDINDRSMDEIEFCEAYIRVDYDGDGIAELRKVVTCADKLPPGDEWNHPIPAVAATAFTAKRVPHRHVGRSLWDELADLQEIKTTLQRQLLDNIYIINNSQKAVNERVNLKDAMTSVPGGLIRVKGEGPIGDALQPLHPVPVLDKILPAIDYWDKTKEIRTGIRPGSDIDPDVLRETTKGAFLESLNRASQKIELIIRMLAETGVKEMFTQIHDLLIRHQDKPRMVQLRGKWVNVNPQEWKERTDLSVKVGLGTGNQEEQRQKLMLLAQMQDRLGAQGMVDPPQAYALFADLAKSLGYEMPEKYIMSPDSPEFIQKMEERKNAPNPEVQVKMAELQQQGQLEQMRMQMQSEVDRNRQQVEAQQQQARMAMEQELARFKAELQMTLEREKSQLQAQVQIEIARINAASKIDAAQITAQTTLTAQQESATDAAVSDNGSPNA